MTCHSLRLIFFLFTFLITKPLLAEPFKIIAFGDSLTAGFGLSQNQAFTYQLEKALQDKGKNIRIINAGVSGDTTSGGLSRLEWTLSEKADAIIVELGANDMLRGTSPSATKKNLDMILEKLKGHAIKVLLVGMKAAPNLGQAYGKEFNALYPALAAKHDVLFYPFFLEGVAGNPSLNQADGIHPNEKGISVIVDNILPFVEKLMAR